MADPLKVDTGDAFQAAQAIGNHAEELRDELTQLVTDWENLSHTWEGVAAKAYEPVWDQWHESAAKVVDYLAESAKRLAVAAVAYEEQDHDSAQALHASGGGIA